MPFWKPRCHGKDKRNPQINPKQVKVARVVPARGGWNTTEFSGSTHAPDINWMLLHFIKPAPNQTSLTS